MPCSENIGDLREAVQTYVDRVRARANVPHDHPLSSGPHLENISKYLARWSDLPLDQDLPSDAHLNIARPAFTTVCNLKETGSRRKQAFSSISDFWRATKAWSIEGQQNSHVVFLQGNPSPQWLAIIGARYDVDPTFFNDHLLARAEAGRPSFFSLPSLPSRSASTSRLGITTIGGLANQATRPCAQAWINGLRENNASLLDQHIKAIRNDRGLHTSDSFVRHFSTHDESHVSFEQDISIDVSASRRGWVALIWMDCGRDLAQSDTTEWMASPLRTEDWKMSYMSTTPCFMSTTFGDYDPRGYHVNDSAYPHRFGVSQTASSLPVIFDANLVEDVTARDSFYALSNIFKLVAAAENQFLNLIQHKIDVETSAEILEHRLDLTNLLYTRQILQRRVNRIEQNVTTLTGLSARPWPNMSTVNKESTRALCDDTHQAVLQDFTYLLHQSKTLLSRCENSMQIVMQSVQFNASKEGIIEARSVTALTRLAFIFIPVTFTATLFGMNFKQLGQGSLSIWIFFVVASPIFVISVLILIFEKALESALLKNNLKRWWRSRRVNPP